LQQYDLAQLGWSDELAPHLGDGLVPARVSAQHRGAYKVLTEDGELTAQLAGRLRHDAGWRTGVLPAVGDWTGVRIEGDAATIVEVVPRRTGFTRQAATDGGATEAQVVAANVDVVFVVAALSIDMSPGFLRRLERYLALAWESGAQPVFVLTKADLCDDVDAVVSAVESIAYGVPVHALSNVTGDGVEAVAAYARPGVTVALLGSSGVGKSTLVNRLAGRELLATQEVRSDGVGRHTTTHRELVPLPEGGLLLDTPGMRLLQLWDAGEGVQETFSDVEELARACRFNDCTHHGEPGCTVQEALDGGTLAQDRLDSWRKLQNELEWLERRQNQRLQAEATKSWRRRRRAMTRDKY
jgi:ribosome biogenesis GTPase